MSSVAPFANPLPGPGVLPTPRLPRPAYSLAGVFLFGAATLGLFVISMFVSSGRLWGPAVSGALAWGLFTVHVLLTRRWLCAFDPGIWVPVNMLLNYFGMVIAVEVLRSTGHTNYDPFRLGTPPQLNLAFVVAILTMTSYLFGMHCAGWMRAGAPPEPFPGTPRSVRAAAWGVFLLGMTLVLVGIPIAGPQILFGAYGDMKLAQKFATADLRFFGTGTLILQSGIFALVASHEARKPWGLRSALFAAITLCVLRVLVGDRALMMLLAMGTGWVYTQHVRRVPHWLVIAGFMGAFLVMPMVGEFRQNRRLEETMRLGVSELAAATFYNMGSSLIPFAYTLEHVGTTKNYTFGLTFLTQVLDNVPNLGLSPGRRFLGVDPLEHNPSKWLVATANPSKWENNAGGYGYAMGAEWYFNFGMVGVLLGPALLGFGMGRVRNGSRASPYALTFAALFFVMVLAWVRNDFGFPFRLFIWPLLALLGFMAVMPRVRVRSEAAPAPDPAARAYPPPNEGAAGLARR